MKITTQDQALAELRRLSETLTAQTARFEGGGAAVKAEAARGLAATFLAMSAVWDAVPKLLSGHKAHRWLTTWSAQDAALMAAERATSWRLIADRHAADAEVIARAAVPAFTDDGMEYVPGRGRVRRQDHGMGEFVQRTNDGVRAARLKALKGGA